MNQVFRRVLTILTLAVFVPALAACGYNTIPTKEERARAQWAEVQNQYQRRADLIPNLVNTVRGYANHEETVLREVTEARASATQVRVDASTLTDQAAFDRYAAAQAQLSGVLGRLMAITENYPNLRANESFLALQSQLEGTENRITIARRDYNEAVRDYNTTLRTFPSVIWASTVQRGSHPMALFSATAGAQTVPTVNFDQPGSSTAGSSGNSAPPPASAPVGGPAPEPAR